MYVFVQKYEKYQYFSGEERVLSGVMALNPGISYGIGADLHLQMFKFYANKS